MTALVVVDVLHVVVSWKDVAACTLLEEENTTYLITLEVDVLILGIELRLQEWADPSNERTGALLKKLNLLVRCLVDEERDFQSQPLRKVIKELGQIVNILLLLILEWLFDSLVELERHEEVLIDSIQNYDLFLEISVGCIIGLQQFCEYGSGRVEQNDSSKHSDDAENPFDIIWSRNVTIPYSRDGCHSPIHWSQILLIRWFIQHFLCLNPRILIIVRESSEEDPKASNNVADHETHNDEEKQSLETLAQLQDVGGVSEDLTLLLDYPDYSDQLRKFDEFVHSTQPSNTHDLIGTGWALARRLLLARRLAEPSEGEYGQDINEEPATFDVVFGNIPAWFMNNKFFIIKCREENDYDIGKKQ